MSIVLSRYAALLMMKKPILLLSPEEKLAFARAVVAAKDRMSLSPKHQQLLQDAEDSDDTLPTIQEMQAR